MALLTQNAAAYDTSHTHRSGRWHLGSDHEGHERYDTKHRRGLPHHGNYPASASVDRRHGNSCTPYSARQRYLLHHVGMSSPVVGVFLPLPAALDVLSRRHDSFRTRAQQSQYDYQLSMHGVSAGC